MRVVKSALLAASFLGAAVSLPSFSPVEAIQSQSVFDTHDQARALIKKADQKPAITLLTDLTKAGVATRETYTLLAEAYILDGAGISAEAAVDRAREAGANFASTALLLAKAKLLQGQPRAALTTLRGLPLSGIEQATALVIMADAQMALGKADLAENFYAEAEQLDPANFQPTLGLARIRMLQNDLEGARASALSAEQKAPDKTMVQYTLGLLDRYSNAPDQGRGRFDRAIELFDNNLLARLEIANLEILAGNLELAEQQLDVVFANSNDNPQANYLSAVILSERGDYGEAHILMNKAAPAIQNYVPGLFVRATIAFEVEAFEIAIDALERIMLAKPANRRARLLLAASYLKMNDSVNTLRTLQPIISSGEADPETLTLAATAATNIGRLERAEEYLRVAKKRAEEAGRSADTVLQGFTTRLAFAQFSSGKSSEAISTLSNSIRNDAADLDRLGYLASMQHSAGDLKGAEASARRLMKAAPERALGYNLMGTIRFTQRQFEEAYDYYTSAIDRRDDYYTAWKNRGLSALRLKRYDEAERDIQRVLQIEPNDTRAKALLGKIFLDTDRPAEAVPYFAEAQRSYPRSPDLLVDLAIARARAGETAQAIRDARSALRRTEQRPDLLRRIGEMLLSLDQFSIATSPLSRYHAYFPNQPDAAILYGRALLGNGLFGGARRIFERALKNTPDDKRKILDWYLFACDVQRGEVETALKSVSSLDRAMRPADISPAFIGIAYQNAGKVDEAIQEFYASYQRTPAPELAISLARSFWQAGQQNEAISILKEENNRDGGDVETSSLLGDYYTALDDALAAAEAYGKALEKGGADPDLLAKLSLAYLKEGRLESHELAERAYLIRPNDPFVLDVFGWVSLQAVRDVETAITLLEQAVDRAPGVAVYRYHLGMVYLAAGRRNAGRVSLQEALNLSNSFDGAEDAREQLARLLDR